MERDTPVLLRATFGLAYELDSIESGKSGIFIQQSTLQD